MLRKRFYDAVRDTDFDSPPHDGEPKPKRRLTISSLLSSTSPTCIVCWEPTPSTFTTDNYLPLHNCLFSCSDCCSVTCASCVVAYVQACVNDRSLLPIRCPLPTCRSVIPLDVLHNIVPDYLIQILHGRDVLALQDAIQLSDAPSSQNPSCRHQDSHEQSLPVAEDCLSQKDAPGNDVNSGDSDSTFLALAREQKWQTCPDCRMIVERSSGCPHMVCLCGAEFCYNCGERWSSTGFGCPRRCGLPAEDPDHLLHALPETFDALRENIWRRFTALYETFRTQLEIANHSTFLPDSHGEQQHASLQSILTTQSFTTSNANVCTIQDSVESTDALTLTGTCDPQTENSLHVVDFNVAELRSDMMRLRSIVHPTYFDHNL